MPNTNLNKEQKIIRNVLYIILSCTIIFSFMVDFFTLINPKYRYLVNIFMLCINGIVFYIGFKKQIINKDSLIATIILVAAIITISLLNR
jgi:cytochrome c oxidase subunit IV